MTLQEASKHCDIGIIYIDGWCWDINCGYQSWGGKQYETIEEAYNNLLTFLETWEGPTK